MPAPLIPLLRPAQFEILQYKSGKWAITAVPGSGKTMVLTLLAANLASRLSDRDIAKGREILIVTYTQSAVYNLKNRINQLLAAQELPETLCRVRTLHGLANDIARENPALLGLPDDYVIVDESTSYQFVTSAVQAHQDTFLAELASERQFPSADRRALERRLAQSSLRFIRWCKDHRRLPGDLCSHPLLSTSALGRFALRVYSSYQRNLAWRGAVDFDDMTALAIMGLEESPQLLNRLQMRWTAILEDEAQDSTHLQERMLQLLSREKQWLRVGDPNQAIYSTFTTSKPHYFLSFSSQKGVRQLEMVESGRSARPVMNLANVFVTWVVRHHPVPELRSSLQPISITSPLPGDAQPAPPTADSHIHIHYQPGVPVTPDAELDLVTRSLQRWLSENPECSAAILVPDNWRGHQVIRQLKRSSIPFDDLLRIRFSTRAAVEKCIIILDYIAFPAQPRFLARLYRQVWWKAERLASATREVDQQILYTRLANAVAAMLVRVSTPEALLWSSEPLERQSAWSFIGQSASFKADFEHFLAHIRDVLYGPPLETDQQFMLLAYEMLDDPTETAIAYQVSNLINNLQFQPSGIRRAADEIRAALRDDRRLGGLAENPAVYSPQPGRVAVTTFHGAKGLEWDRVYLLSVNNLAFPSGETWDRFPAESNIGAATINLDAEMLGLLSAASDPQGLPTDQARLAYCAERLRLLYVGLTRARRDLIILWHNQQYSHQGRQIHARAALPIRVLHEYLNGLYTP